MSEDGRELALRYGLRVALTGLILVSWWAISSAGHALEHVTGPMISFWITFIGGGVLGYLIPDAWKAQTRWLQRRAKQRRTR